MVLICSGSIPQYHIICDFNQIKLTPDDCDPHMKHGVGKS